MVARDVGRENGVTAKGHRVSFRGDGNVQEIALIIAELCEYIKYHRTVRFKRIRFMVCGLYLNLKNCK